MDYRKTFLVGVEDGPVKITVELGGDPLRLSITGDGPGYGGQCQDSIREALKAGTLRRDHARYTPDLSVSDIEKVLDVWDRWHLNDMRATCEHQRALGWDVEALEKATIYQWRLKPEISKEKKRLEDEALERAKSVEEGHALGFRPPERRILALEEFIKTGSPELGELARWYEATRDDGGYFGHKETKTRGWINYEKDDITGPGFSFGILGKPCPVCGYKYGHAWNLEPVPVDVINFLKSL